MPLRLSRQDVDYIGRVVDTEVGQNIKRQDPQMYQQMVKAVTDTIMNRVMSDRFPNTVEGVVNQDRQFSKINGPNSYVDKNGRRIQLNPYKTVDRAPKAPAEVQSIVETHIADRVAGAPSTVGGNLHYANPNYSSPNNLRWINELDGPRLGIGDSVHWHGTDPAFQPVPEYIVSMDYVPESGVQMAALPDIQERPSITSRGGFERGSILAPETSQPVFAPNQAAAAELPPQGPMPLAPVQGPMPLGEQQGPAPLAPVQGPSVPSIENTMQEMSDLTTDFANNAPVQGPMPLAPMQGPMPLGDFQGPMPLAPVQGPMLDVPRLPNGEVNRESMTDEEYQTYLETQVAVPPAPPSPAASVAPPAAPVVSPAPVTPAPAIPAPVAPVAPVQSTSPAAPVAPMGPPMPSGNDVWNNQANFGIANGDYEIQQLGNGKIGRYSPEYDRTDIIQNGSQIGSRSGRINVEEYQNSGPNLPSFGGIRDRMTENQGRGVLAGLLAGVVGNAVAGPIGAMVAGQATKRMVQGRADRQAMNTYNGQPITPNTFPTAPVISYESDNSGRSRAETEAAIGSAGVPYSSRTIEAAYNGAGGLF